ncbi:hypothetical protein MUN89_21045 [Halobacillus salinarum]|uniref:Uncharacterized protein n=1 Tax=Halobacillus salinarum TaxID=2932257 RepID=A0ABY4EIL3_9BACI|nr:hypothetical protein [Halobacillus salinarum]UOQ44302.1 hypothetical protein MUN89_21045 [Halobacillus salinarum]
MSDYLLNLLTRRIVSTLPKKQKDIYTYVVKIEDEIAEEAATKTEFMNRLQHDNPHELAAEHFGLTLFELLQMMKEIEEEVARQLIPMMEAVEWIDCTDLVGAKSELKENQKVFFVPLPQ